jgi:hypothetical protein
MAWKGRSQDTQNFNDLLTILANSRLQVTSPPLYNCLWQLLTRLTKLTTEQQTQINEIVGLIDDIGNTIITIEDFNNALKELVWILGEPAPTDPATDVLVLPNARQLLAGAGITFDDTVANERTINASATGSGYWTPLTDGDVDETDLIFAAGEAIAVFVPV